ncbi:hypothetical protein ACP4OV_024995 [Aristida adscensionis]
MRGGDVCMMLLLSICVAAVVVGFMKLPVGWAVSVVFYLMFIYILMISCVTALRDHYLEEQAGENAQAPN